MTYSILISSKALQSFLELLAGTAILFAFLKPRTGRRLFRQIESRFAQLSRKPRHAVAIAAMFPLLIRALLLPVFPIPTPRIHDEFSYLLLADTLAHGRLANPTPPSPRHFETEYELMRPVYASQYQPGQGMFLAAGQVIAGHPWWGVWLSIGFMCGSLCWALQGILPSRWALFGASIAALQFGIFGFWMNSYFGGAVAASAGALVFGALTRRKHPVTCATGLILLFATRPAEALIWAVAILIVSRNMNRIWLIRLAMVFLIGVAALATYDFRITGNALHPPYLLYREIYGTPQSYWWQPPVVVTRFNNPQLRQNYEDQLNHWALRSSPAALWKATWRRGRDFWRFFIGPFLTPPLLFLPLVIRRKKLRIWLWISALFILDHATYHAWYPQQSAPAAVLIVGLLTEAWRQLRIWRRRNGFGFSISRQLISAFAAAIVLLSLGIATGLKKNVWASIDPGPTDRDRAIHRLNTHPGKHLIFVHYGPDHHWYDEWVFNEADLQASRIVFARMITPESDEALARAMPDRDIWIADPDEKTLEIYRP